MRIIFLSMFVAMSAAAQIWTSYAFSGLSVNRDGTTFLFSSPLRLRGATDQGAWEKIFSWTAKDGVRLIAQRSPESFVRAWRFGWDGVGYYHLITPSISADGQTMALTGRSDCTAGAVCAYSRERWETTIRFADCSERRIAGSARLSANGRYVLTRSSLPLRDATWVDVLTGQSVPFSELVTGGPRPVANDGTTVRRVGQQALELWRPGSNPFQPTEVKSLPGLTSTGAVLLSSDARALVTRIPTGLVRYEIATSKVNSISSSPSIEAVDISEDGTAVLLRESGVYRVWRSSDSGLRDLLVSGQITDAVLSGDGSTVFAVVDGSRVVRVDVDRGQVAEVIPRSTYAIAQFNMSAEPIVGLGSLL